MVKNPPTNAGDIETRVRSLDQEDPLEEGMATHSSILAWRIPWTGEVFMNTKPDYALSYLQFLSSIYLLVKVRNFSCAVKLS